MSAALHIPRPDLGPDEMAHLIHGWAMRADWLRVRHVVWVGSPDPKPWEILRRFRPDVQVVVYHEGGEPRRLDQSAQVCSSPVELHAAIASVYHTRDRIEIIGEPALRQHMPRVRALIDSAVTYAVAQEITTRERSERWINLGLRLLPHMADRPPVNALPEAWQGRPAVVIGSGPSLEDDLDTLREIRNDVLLIAASSAAGALHRGGVQPHMWVCAEEQDVASDDLRRLGNHEGSYLVPGVHCHEAFWTLPSLGVVPLIHAIAIGNLLIRR